MPQASSIMVNAGAFQSLGGQNRPGFAHRIESAGKSLPCQRPVCPAMKNRSLFRDRLAPETSAPATVHAARHPRHPSTGLLRADGQTPEPATTIRNRDARPYGRMIKVLKRMVRPAWDHMTAKGRVSGLEMFLEAASRAASSISSSLRATHLRIASSGAASLIHGTALAPLFQAGAGASVIQLSQTSVASLPLPGSSSVSALTRARTRRVSPRPDVRIRVSHGQQNADRCQPPGRNAGGGATW